MTSLPSDLATLSLVSNKSPCNKIPKGQPIGSIEVDVENIPTKDQEQILCFFRIVFPKYQQATAVALKQA